MMAALATAAMTLGELFGTAAGNLDRVEVEDLVLDSRQVRPGVAFIALPGTQGHGLDHLGDALARGATAIVYEPSPRHAEVTGPSIAIDGLSDRLGTVARDFFGRDSRQPTLTGVTGTNGKSTVAYLIAQAQTLRGNDCGYLGTLGFGVPPELVTHALTTPDCLSLHRTLHSMSVKFAAMEVSSHALAQNRIAGLHFDTAIFTNLSQDHLDYHGSFENYLDAKASLFEREGLQHAVFFADDPATELIASRLRSADTRINVSLSRDADIRGHILSSDLDGLVIELRSADETAEIRSPLVGDFNAENLLLAVAALQSMDLSLSDACDALSRCASLPGRMQVFGGQNDTPWVVVDFAHTPDALTRALENLKHAATNELWCVFGCGGQRDVGKRAAMGQVAAQLADHVVLTDDNPRDEDPGAIVAQICAGTVDHPDVWVEHDRARAIADAVGRASAGDIVLVAGKGNEQTQWIAGEQREFNDRVVVEQVLEGLT